MSQCTLVSAQNWQERAKKEGTEYLRKALSGEESNAKGNDKKTTAGKPTTKPTSSKKKGSTSAKTRKDSGSAAKRSPKTVEFTMEQINIVRNYSGPLIQYVGKTLEPCYSGTLEGNWTYPAHTKTESAQNAWNDKRMERQEGDETLSNARLVREIAASKKWIDEQEKMGGPIREFMATIPSRLDMELYERANKINEYVEAMNELINAAPDEDLRTLNYQVRLIDRYLKSPYYQRAIATSLEGLRQYLTPATIQFFEQRGGLKNAHSAKRLTWPADSK
ncbi:MAG: hypothetical protein ACI30K_05975 [Muribaculaceae bacterium]